MTVTELLESVRRVEARTNRLVQSSSPGFQLLWIAAGVEDGQNDDAFRFDQKMNHKRKPAENHRPADFAAHFGKPFGIVRDALKLLLNDGAKFLSQSLALAFVIGNGVIKLLPGNAAKDKAALHLRYLASSFALTSSSDTTSSGFWRWSWRRRSMSSASPGVSSPSKTPYFSQTFSATCFCSPGGKCSICSRISVALMALIYSVGSFMQAGVLRRKISSFYILPYLYPHFAMTVTELLE